MGELPYVNLPDYFTHLLKVNMQSTGPAFKNLGEYIQKNRAFTGLLEQAFKDIDKDLRVDQIIKMLGWHGLRDRLSGLFLHHRRHGQYPHTTNGQMADGVNRFEETLRPFGVDGLSRTHLLGLYVEMALVDTTKSPSESHEAVQALNALSPRNLVGILGQSHARVARVDWLVIACAHFNSFLGPELALKHARGKMAFRDLWSLLEADQKVRFMENMLAYGSSINDMDFFTGTRV